MTQGGPEIVGLIIVGGTIGLEAAAILGAPHSTLAMLGAVAAGAIALPGLVAMPWGRLRTLARTGSSYSQASRMREVRRLVG